MKDKKALKIIILAFVALLVIGFVALGFHSGPALYRMHKLDIIKSDTGFTRVSTTLTTEQKLSDFDYMYKVACLDNPNKELCEKTYGISYEDLYNRYRGLIEGSADEFEYISYLQSFLAILPGLHNELNLPDYELTAVNGRYSLLEIYGDRKVKDYTYSWNEAFRDDVDKYRAHNTIAFKYIDGQYINIGSKSTRVPFTNDYERGQLISIDGKAPKDMCFDLFSSSVPKYDCGNDCFFRDTLIFNDGTGTKHEAEILMPDGTTVTTDIYEDPRFEIAITSGIKAYPDLFVSTDNETSAPAQAASDEPYSYKLYTDSARKLVYINSITCDSYEGRRLIEDLKKAADEVDAENIVIDIRSNDGGDYTFVTEQLLPAVFSHDVEYKTDIVGIKNDHTENYYGSRFYQANNRSKTKDGIRTDKKYYYCMEDLSVKGNADRDYNIYLLTSQTTFSAADIMACLCKEYDNAVIVGTNTKGEGIAGTPYNCYLPESRFMFVYEPTRNAKHPENNIYGTQPDVFVPFTVDEYYKKLDLTEQGLDVNNYETRQMWDQTLLKVFELIDNK